MSLWGRYKLTKIEGENKMNNCVKDEQFVLDILSLTCGSSEENLQFMNGSKP
jgi:hypothetical protein